MTPTFNSPIPKSGKPIVIPERVALRALERYDVDENGCHISRYSVAAVGYAQVGWKDGAVRHMVGAHRAAWVAVNGQIPLGLVIDHMCHQRRCVNPDHLRLLTHAENAAWSRPKLRCIRGHAFDEDNTYIAPSGARQCRSCRRIHWANSEARKKASA